MLPPDRVRSIQIDATAHCQLACPVCPTANGTAQQALGAGHLDPAKFERLLRDNPSIASVELSNWGEMFLNPKLPELLRIAHENGVAMHGDNGVNLNHASNESLEALVRYQVRSLWVSLDGATDETYSIYRRKGELSRVIDNIQKINEWKRKYQSVFPILGWRFILFGHNEHEIDSARALAASLDMQFTAKLNWDATYSPIQNPELVQIQTGLPASRAAFAARNGIEYARGCCHQLWYAPVLNWDGLLNGCCYNYWGLFGGNAFDLGLDQVLQTPKFLAARNALMGKAAMPSDVPCASCDQYQAIQRTGKWITPEEISVPDVLPAAVGIVPIAQQTEATHVDLFLVPGHTIDPILLVRPPSSQRVDLSRQMGSVFVANPGDFTICAIPRRLDPTFRKQYPPLPPVTHAISVQSRPIVQQFQIPLGS